MLHAAVAETLCARLDRADAERLVGVRLKHMAADVRTVQLHPRQPGKLPELRLVGFTLKLLWYALHARLPCSAP